MGKRRLEKAMSTYRERIDFEVNWRPFQLNRNAPKEGIDKMEMYKEKFGEARVKQMIPRMKQVFADVGLKYSLEGLTGNTLNSHRLVVAAQKQGRGNELVEELMDGYFCNAKFLNDRSFLMEAAKKAGVKDAKAVLDDEQMHLQQVMEEMRHFGNGVTGVPMYVINGRPSLSGAQEPEVFEKIFAHLAGPETQGAEESSSRSNGEADGDKPDTSSGK